MRNSFLFLMQLVGTVTIAQNSAFSNRTIQLDGITTVHIVRQSAAGKMHVGARLYHSFPAYDFHQLEDSLAPGDTEHWFQCPVRSVLEGSVLIGQTELRLIMIPGDTIHVYATPIDSTANPKMTFLLAGKTKAVQAYCLAKEKQFPEDPDENSMNIGGSTRTLGDFQHRIDSNYAIQRTFWQQYRRENQLPAWFIRYETNAMQYCDARLRLYMIAYRQFVNKIKEPIPGDYFAFLDKLPIRNDEARYDYYYLRFLEQYLHWKAKQNTRSTDYDVTQTTEFKLANPLLGYETGDFFRLWTLSYGLLSRPAQARSELLKMSVLPTNKYLKTYLLTRFNDRLTALKPGEKAPNFFLPDTRDSLASLSQFKGNVVLLCFWFAGCRGCVAEFQAENQLVKQFSNAPVRIISVCTQTRPAKWHEAISGAGLKTVNLFANAAWRKTLEEKYAISAYPHYVLIGADGRIIENFAPRPSQNAADKIKAALVLVGEK